MQKFVDSLESHEEIAPYLVYRGTAEQREACMVEPRSGLPPGAAQALERLGIRGLYAHQAQTLDRIVEGGHTLLATPTASGKTLAYLLGFAARRALDPEARGLFIYPLKALARDQLTTIRTFLEAMGIPASEAAEVYDGDTPENLRRKIRRSPPAVIVTNPDMLHLGLLPYHEIWSGFFAHLGTLVIDEAHAYRGIFGAHVHHVLRRLLRLVGEHGGGPVIVAGSATIGEPQQFIERLTGESFSVIRESGAPVMRRHVVFLQPHDTSPYTLATKMLARTVSSGFKTIAFTKARRITELMHQWLIRMAPELSRKVAGYRAGYLPEERRAIENKLFGGELSGVISTSALEAGIDVGGLDVCILVGYPGSLATAWQRIGRAGRSDRESLAILVAMPDALDRYVVRHPEHFFSGEFERVMLDPENDMVADAHLQAAAAEKSLDPATVRFLGGANGAARATRLVSEGKLAEAHEGDRWVALRRRPQRDIPLRSMGSPFTLRLVGTGRTLGTMDSARVWFEGHPGAIYLHSGRTFRVLDLDSENRTVMLEGARVDYYTQVYARKETEILEEVERRPCGPAQLVHGRVRVTTFIEGYGRRRVFGLDEISRHTLDDAPPQILETTAFWFELPAKVLGMLVADERHPVGGLHAVEHATIGLFPLLAISDRWDLGGISYARHPQLDLPAVFIYDAWPGGVGLARTAFERAEELFQRTRDLVADCSCDEGCPGCVYSPKCGSGNVPLDKAGALDLLNLLTGRRDLPAEVADESEVAPWLERHRKGSHAGVRGADAPVARGGDTLGDPAAHPKSGEGPHPGAVKAMDLSEAGWPEDVKRPSELLAESEGRWLYFDLETLRGASDVGGWGNISKMGMALGVVLDGATGHFQSYFQDDVEALVERLLAADRVVGFNLDRFDMTVLEGHVGSRVREIKTLDMLSLIREKIGIRLKLAHLGEQTLGWGKSADGLQSLEWVKQGRLDLVNAYCRDDVLLTAALWAYGRQNRYVLFQSRDGIKARIPVSW